MLQLWHESQEKICCEAKAEDIAKWTEIRDPSELQRFIDGAIEVEFLRSDVTDPLTGQHPKSEPYHICGNLEQLEGIVARKNRAKKGGQATRQKWTAQFGGPNDNGESSEEDPPRDEDAPPEIPDHDMALRLGAYHKRACSLVQARLQPSASVANSIQFNSTQLSSKKQEEAILVTSTQSDNPDTPNPTAPLLPGLIAGNVPRGTSAKKEPAGAIEPFSLEPDLVESLERVSHRTQNLWIRVYGSTPEDLRWLVTKLLFIADWRRNNPRRGPQVKGFEQWYSNWLETDFRKYQKSIPTQGSSKAVRISESNRSLQERIKKGEL